jgi:hypothetical protein
MRSIFARKGKTNMCHNCKHHQGKECDCEGKCENEGCNCGEGSCGCGDCSSGSCHCGDGSHFQRQYRTKAEQIVELEAYLGELKLEVQAVEEKLADLHK